MMLLAIGLAAALLTSLVTPVVARYARARGITDDPATAPDRRIHTHPVPLLGGLAIWGTLLIFATWFTVAHPLLTVRYLEPRFILGLLLGSSLLMIGGYLDDRYQLPPRHSIFFPVLAAIIVVASGIGVNFITRPWGGVWRIDRWSVELWQVRGQAYALNLGADLFTFLWLMGMMYTTKFLDGLDGLTSGVTVIGAGILTLLSLKPYVAQPDTALLAVVVAGSFLGFLWHNWSPAKIFLGEGGSLLAGFLLGVLAIIAGGKIATTLLVVGIPALDVLWVILRRTFWEGRSPTMADRKHLHFRLLDLGLSVRQAVVILYVLTAAFGLAALSLQSRGKLLALLLLAATMGVIAVSLTRLRQPSASRTL